MDTKLRNISTNNITKIMAIALLVICMTAVTVMVQYIGFRRLDPESLYVEKFRDSELYVRYIGRALFQTYDVIRSGGDVSRDIDFLYYITDGETSFSNTNMTEREDFAQYDSGFYMYENEEWSSGENTGPILLLQSIDGDYTIYVAFPDELLATKQLEWQEMGEKLRVLQAGTIISLILSLFLIIFLVCVTGRAPQDRELHLSKLDKTYTDIQFAFIILLTAYFNWSLTVKNSIYDSGGYIDQISSMFFWGTVTAVFSLLYILTILSMSRKIKAGKFLKHSLIYMAGCCIQSIFDGRIFAGLPLTKSLFYRQLVFIAVSVVLVFFAFVFFLSGSLLFLIFPILEGIIIYLYIKGNNETFHAINKDFDASLEEQMRAERMKVALVTNVSHDLKTPLTSIISYADLLSKEENLPDTAGDYVRILSDKANRLNQIVSDLFDLSKSTTGNIVLDLELLDVKKLIEQTLADMGDQIEKAETEIKTKLPENPVNIVADGKRLYRVFQNVIDNALKYSHRGTRIYVELTAENNLAVATVKNTAGYEMDFSAEEILQRFTRGDKSRTTEGSGLGLSIAESFTNVCGGEFKVEIDGDLFKVIIIFKIA